MQTGTVTMDTNTISNVCPIGGPGYSGGLYYESSVKILPIGPSQGPSSVPEPATMFLLGLGLMGLGGVRRKFKQ